MKDHGCHVECLGYYPEGSGELWSGLPFGSDLPFRNITVEPAWKMDWEEVILEAGSPGEKS